MLRGSRFLYDTPDILAKNIRKIIMKYNSRFRVKALDQAIL